MFLAQTITLPSIEQVGSQPVWVVIAFMALSAMAFASLMAVSGFFILKGLLQVVQGQQAALKTQQDSDNEDRKKMDAIDAKVDKTNVSITTGLDQLKSTSATHTGQLRQEASSKELLVQINQVTNNTALNAERIVNALSSVPQATADLLITKFSSIDENLKLLIEKPQATAELKEKIIQLEATVAAIPQALEDCLKKSAQADRDATAADKTIDAQAHQIDILTHPDPLTLPAIDPGAQNRDALEKAS